MRKSTDAKRLGALANALLLSQDLERETARIGCATLPHETAVQALIALLRRVVFPGYWDHSPRSSAHCAKALIKDLAKLEKVARQLIKTTLIAENLSDKSERVARQFCDGLPTIGKILVTDVEAAWQGDPAAKSRHEIVYAYPGIEAILVHRCAHFLTELSVPLLPRLMAENVHGRTGIDIHPGARIGHSFFIDHGTGVVIGETCEIGDHVTIYQGVTLGALSFPRHESGELIRGQKRHPTLQNHVKVFANATVLGGTTVVGHHSLVGSGVWLDHSIEPYSSVTMEPPVLRVRERSGKAASKKP